MSLIGGLSKQCVKQLEGQNVSRQRTELGRHQRDTIHSPPSTESVPVVPCICTSRCINSLATKTLATRKAARVLVCLTKLSMRMIRDEVITYCVGRRVNEIPLYALIAVVEEIRMIALHDMRY